MNETSRTSPASAAPQTPMMGGYRDPVTDSAIVFRKILGTMSSPGSIIDLGRKTGLENSQGQLAAYASILTLCDADTRVWVSPVFHEFITAIRFHCGCPITQDPRDAAFVLAEASELHGLMPNLEPGTSDYPDRSATAVIAVSNLSAEPGAELSGPGIDGMAQLSLGSDNSLWPLLQRNNARFPLGIDVILTHGDLLAAVPRSTRILSLAEA